MSLNKCFFILLILLGFDIKAQQLGNELIINGDFSDGGPTQSELSYSYTFVGPGEYTVTNSPYLRNSTFVNPPNSSGSFMIVDINGDEDTGKRIWYTDVKVESGKTYLFSFQTANINGTLNNPPVIMVAINGAKNGKIFKLPPNSNNWASIKIRYDIKENTNSVTIALYNILKEKLGNDLALDNFSMREIITPGATKKKLWG